MNTEKSHVGMGVCFYCGEPDGTVLLDRRLRPTLPRYSVHTIDPCPACRERFKDHILLVEVTNEDKPTGFWCTAPRDELLPALTSEELRNSIAADGMAKVLADEWDAMGLPRK